MTAPIIETENLCCRMGQNYLLKNVSWRVAPGEHWAVYGMNGSGKTTLLSIVAGFKHFTAGRVKIDGCEYAAANALSLRKKIGFVSSSFFDIHYGRENVLDIVLSGKSGALSLNDELTLQDAVLARALLKELGLQGKMDRQFDMLSKGERQNVLIARALISRPAVLIMDEPCNGLDAYHRQYLLQALNDLAQEMTIIYVTHYLEEITPLFRQSLLLKNGTVFAQGAADEVFTAPIMSALLGHPTAIERDRHGRMSLHIKTAPNITKLLRGE